MRRRFRDEVFMYDNTPYESRIPQLVATAKQIKSGCLDYSFHGFKNNDMRLENPNHVSFKFGQGREKFCVLPFASRQLCEHIGLPYNYYSMLARSRKPEMQDLLRNTVNTLAKQNTEGMVVRTYKNQIRGIVSPKYFVFDTDAILDVFTEAFNDSRILPTNEIIMHGDYLGLDLFHMRFTHSEPIKGIEDKDLYYGMQLSSSDVGRSSIKLRFYVFKQVCSNGLCMDLLNQELVTQRHMYVHKDYVYAALMSSFKAFPQMMSQANKQITVANAWSLEDSPLLSINTPEKEEERKARERMQKYLKISDEAMYELARIVAKEYKPTLWGYVNAITNYAQRFGVERRVELEQMAGRLLNGATFKQVA